MYKLNAKQYGFILNIINYMKLNPFFSPNFSISIKQKGTSNFDPMSYLIFMFYLLFHLKGKELPGCVYANKCL